MADSTLLSTFATQADAEACQTFLGRIFTGYPLSVRDSRLYLLPRRDISTFAAAELQRRAESFAAGVAYGRSEE